VVVRASVAEGSAAGAPAAVRSGMVSSMAEEGVAGDTVAEERRRRWLELSSFYAIIKRVTSAVNKELRLAGDVTTEAGEVALSCTLVGALPLTPLVPQAVGALDGRTVRIQGPAPNTTNTPSEFYGCKGLFRLNVRAIGDGRCLFVFLSTAAQGAMHDSAAWSQTRLAERLQAAAICLGERFVICDDAFPACSHLVPLRPGAALPAYRDAF